MRKKTHKKMTNNIEIYINHLGPIRDSRIELSPFMVFSGESGTGKSYTALLVHYIYKVLCNRNMSDFFAENNASYDKHKEQLPDADSGLLYEFTLQQFEEWCNSSAIQYMAEALGHYDLEGSISIKFNGPTDKYRFSYTKEVMELDGEMKYYDTILMNNEIPLRLPYNSTQWNGIPYAVLFAAYLKQLFGITQSNTFLLPPSRGGIVCLNDRGRIALDGMYEEFMWDLSDLKAAAPQNGTETASHSALSQKLIDGKINLRDNDLYYEQTYGEIPIMASAASIKELAPFAIMLQKGLVSKYSIMFEEPETNLHPELQITVADILAILLANGCRFQVTTHSDYFLRRINDLLRLDILKNSLTKDEYEAFCREHHYDPALTISSAQVNAYYFKRNPDKTVSVVVQDVQNGIPFDTFRSVLKNQQTDSSFVYDKLCQLNESAD